MLKPSAVAVAVVTPGLMELVGLTGLSARELVLVVAVVPIPASMCPVLLETIQLLLEQVALPLLQVVPRQLAVPDAISQPVAVEVVQVAKEALLL